MTRLAPLVLCLFAPLAQAQLWGYVDSTGVAHFAHEHLDSRYQSVMGNAPPPLRVPGKTDGGAGLLTWLEIAPEVKAVQPWLREASQVTGVDIELLKAVIAVESSFNPRAVSPRGAIGLMQLMPDSAERFAREPKATEPVAQRLLDARTNILTGARMLAELMRRFGRIDLALAAWNAGEAAVLRSGGQMPALAQTRTHVQLVLELYWALLQRSLPKQATQVKMEDAVR
jgi:hypothetical protein